MGNELLELRHEISSILYRITREDAQHFARKRIGRELTEEELDLVKKGLESGLNFGLDIVFAAAIDDAIEDYEKTR
jgi:hypothetical protein